MKRALALAALTLAASCATPPPAAPPTTRPVAIAPPPIYVAPPAPRRDQCGADALQTLLGKPRTEIPVPVNPGLRRVTCTTCPMTLDFQPFRLNILYDEETGLVRQVRCG